MAAAATATPSVAPEAGDRKAVAPPVDAVDLELDLELEEKHVLAVDDSSVDRAVIAKILRSSKYRGEHRAEEEAVPALAVRARAAARFI
jgi:two-component response regulator ARR-A family